jgi:hypothetical protein
MSQTLRIKRSHVPDSDQNPSLVQVQASYEQGQFETQNTFDEEQDTVVNSASNFKLD